MSILDESVLVKTIKEMVRDNEYISEITLNGPNKIFYKEKGQPLSKDINIVSEEQYMEEINELIEDAKLIKNKYLVEGKYLLPNGKAGRLHIVMPPASPLPLVTLAIKTETLTDLSAVGSAGTFDIEISKFLKAAIGAKLTTVISGGTGAGKTTLLEAMAGEFKDTERIGVCEDSPELRLKTPNTAYLNSTVWVPGLDEKDVAPLEWIVKQVNRMRVNRTIVGETRGPELFDFIIGANSGAEGSLTTLHANDGPSAMKKMSTFMYMAVDMSPRIINEMIAETVDVVIQLGHSKIDGSHKILSIHEVTNSVSSGSSPTIVLNPLFVYDHDSNKWNKKYPTDGLKKKLELNGYNPNTYTLKENDRKAQGGGGLPSYFTKEDY